MLLIANQPERTTRLKLFESTLKDLGYHVIVPSFGTVNWIKIAWDARRLIEREKPDIVHIFNVPDIIYHRLPEMRGRYYKRLIYDYRSPWGVETRMRFGAPGQSFCEHYERCLARSADMITTVNSPLRKKASGYAPDKDIHIVPNYPARSFVETQGSSGQDSSNLLSGLHEGAVIFVGRVCEQEGIGNLIRIARSRPEQEFWIVGGGPFAWWYMMNKPDNVRALGWQPHDMVADLVRHSGICVIPREENALTPYSTDRSIWKLNEYLNMGKTVVASGITMEERRKNLVVVGSVGLEDEISRLDGVQPEQLRADDYRFWETNRDRIRKVYEAVL